MHNNTPSSRWIKRFFTSFVKHGGHNGDATLSICLDRYGIPLYREGATAQAAGLAAATAYRLHRQVTDLREEVDGLRYEASKVN